MKHYEKLLQAGYFSRGDLIQLVGTPDAARMVVYEYQKKGYIERVKRDFYVAISLETKQPLLSRYEIGSNLFPDAYLSHHSAFEYYGYANQVYYECYVATDSRFSEFEYDGIRYRRLERKPGAEVIQEGKVRVTSIEQTVVDSIQDIDKISGYEEVIRCIEIIPSLKEDKVLDCLKRSGNGFLYQKCGFLFEGLLSHFGFSKYFFEECQRNSSNAKRYFIKEKFETTFNEKWKLYTPSILESIIYKGMPDLNDFI